MGDGACPAAPEGACARAPQLDFLLVTGELLVIDARRCWDTEEEIFSMHSIPRRACLERPE